MKFLGGGFTHLGTGSYPFVTSQRVICAGGKNSSLKEGKDDFLSLQLRADEFLWKTVVETRKGPFKVPEHVPLAPREALPRPPLNPKCHQKSVSQNKTKLLSKGPFLSTCATSMSLQR